MYGQTSCASCPRSPLAKVMVFLTGWHEPFPFKGGDMLRQGRVLRFRCLVLRGFSFDHRPYGASSTSPQLCMSSCWARHSAASVTMTPPTSWCFSPTSRPVDVIDQLMRFVYAAARRTSSNSSLKKRWLRSLASDAISGPAISATRVRHGFGMALFGRWPLNCFP